MCGMERKTHNLGRLGRAIESRTAEAVVGAVPLVAAGVAVDDFPAGKGVEVAVARGERGHVPRLGALVRGEGADSEAREEADGLEGSGRQSG